MAAGRGRAREARTADAAHLRHRQRPLCAAARPGSHDRHDQAHSRPSEAWAVRRGRTDYAAVPRSLYRADAGVCAGAPGVPEMDEEGASDSAVGSVLLASRAEVPTCISRRPRTGARTTQRYAECGEA